MNRFLAAIIVCAIGLTMLPGVALAHHGWRWTTGQNIELTGIVKTAKLGNPHGVLEIDADGEIWTVQVGQPWRNQNAGLKPGDLAVDVEVRIIGEPSADIGDKKMKAERIYIGDREYVLYPDRD